MNSRSILFFVLTVIGQLPLVADQFEDIIEELAKLPTPNVDRLLEQEGSGSVDGSVLFAAIANDAKAANNSSSKTKLTELFIGGLLHEERGVWQAVLKRANSLDELEFSPKALSVVENYEPELGYQGRYYVMLGAIGNEQWMPILKEAANDTSEDFRNMWYSAPSWSATLALAKMGDEDRSIEISDAIREALAYEFSAAHRNTLGSQLIYVGDNHTIGVLIDFLFDDRNFPKRVDVDEGKYYYETQKDWYALWAANKLARFYDEMPEASGNDLEFVMRAREWIEQNILNENEALSGDSNAENVDVVVLVETEQPYRNTPVYPEPDLPVTDESNTEENEISPTQFWIVCLLAGIVLLVAVFAIFRIKV